MDSEKEKLYAMLFRSFKANFGVDIEAESGNPVKDFQEKFDRGENDPPMIEVVISYLRGDREGFLKNYPEELRDFLWEICRQAEERRASEDLDR